MSPRPELPRRLVIGHLTYSVARDQAHIDRSSAALGGELAGVSGAADQKIGLAVGLAPDYEAETLLHEILHQCLNASGFDQDDDQEERTICAMTGPLLSTLRRNPKLVAYLLGRELNQREAGRRRATRRKGGPNDGRTRTSTEGPEPTGAA